MTNTHLSKAELANVYTVGGTDEAPVVDGLGNPRFLSVHDFPHDTDDTYGMAAAERDAVIDDWDADYAAWQAEQEAMWS